MALITNPLSAIRSTIQLKSSVTSRSAPVRTVVSSKRFSRTASSALCFSNCFFTLPAGGTALRTLTSPITLVQLLDGVFQYLFLGLIHPFHVEKGASNNHGRYKADFFKTGQFLHAASRCVVTVSSKRSRRDGWPAFSSLRNTADSHQTMSWRLLENRLIPPGSKAVPITV